MRIGSTVRQHPTTVGDQLNQPRRDCQVFNARQRRPLVLTSSVSGEGPISGTTPPEQPQYTPGILTMYPGCTPRPRNKRVYDAACAAANGQHVIELNACQIKQGMRAWCGGSFLTVAKARHMRLGDIESLENQISQTAAAHPFVLLHLRGDGATTGWLIGELDTPVYCLA